MIRAQIDKEYRNKTVGDFIITDHNRDAVEVTQQYSDSIADRVKCGEGIYLYSSMDGTGKTLLANLILMYYAKLTAGELYDSDYRYRSVGADPDELILPGLFYPVRQVMAEKKAFMDTQNIDSLTCPWDEYARRTTILVVDDFLAGFNTDWILSQMWELIDYRWRKMKPTIFTSNFPLHTLDQYGERGRSMCARIFQRCTNDRVVELTGPSYRALAGGGLL